ncbi:protein of unknown function [Methanoculleus bourgensis]|uniref:Uncharacterized protein n=1 Tax=Methanoculleus bourgensis TaxID=83986 RepID=A0A0X3BM06_9EURY|nr:protein of unknown function [Methanoculleus bourgensis]
MAKKIENVGCPFCGVCCDDLVVTVSDDGKKILEVENAASSAARSSTVPWRIGTHCPASASRTAPTKRSPTMRQSITRQRSSTTQRNP